MPVHGHKLRWSPGQQKGWEKEAGGRNGGGKGGLGAEGGCFGSGVRLATAVKAESQTLSQAQVPLHRQLAFAPMKLRVENHVALYNWPSCNKGLKRLFNLGYAPALPYRAGYSAGNVVCLLGLCPLSSNAGEVVEC